ncbi:hypothetical protein [Streptomyces sp. VRA16 Mangrove soil]|uniref:hypothetical protein n=1 Tax=Streptomyces sp. VRA16 Mangrove soil TaxID=2817434 RepID=UPI001A9FCB1C|nr:hypothetical protein [Streptomyces sp. VRA16 Mangrove soil]MBO1334531.1 hypothetical protein [Streptomyces sp. VRA16 Mangrove soil]
MRGGEGVRSRAVAVGAVLAAVFAAAGCGADTEPRGDRPTGGAHSSPGSQNAALTWEFAHIADFSGRFTDVAALAEDDVWAVATENDGGTGPFLMHYDGARWTRESLPDAIGPSDAPPALDEIGDDTLWLRPKPTGRSSGAQGWARWDGTRWSAVPSPPAGTVGDLEAAGPDDIWALTGERTAAHWNGDRWTTTRLPYEAADLAVVGPDDAWAVGRRSTGPGTEGSGGLPYDQPASMHWDGTSWRAVDTPVSRFDDPVPPEASASLGKVFVLDGGEVRAYGENTFDHGETDDEPEDKYIRLRWTGSAWVAQDPAPGGCERRVPLAQDAKGLFLDGNRYLTDTGRCVTIQRPRLPRSTGARSSSNQSLWLSEIHRVPGTGSWLGAGHVQVNQSGAPFDAPVVVRLERSA